ncbi:MAG: hypothetical protein H6707_12305 [Deltaproteobacteria bacterium]|nr:hypothetical protein [Deltaproteobacteria bacterium]
MRALKSTAERRPKFSAATVGRILLAEDSYIAAHNRIYVFKGGVYRPEGQKLIQKRTQDILGAQSRRHCGVETCYWIETERRVADAEVDAGELVNVANGLLNPRTGELNPHSPSDLSTVQLPTEWNPNAYHERADQFLREVLPDEATRLMVLEFAGYLLSPHCRYQKALMLTGEGSTGKSTLLDFIVATIGQANVSSVRLQNLDSRFQTACLLGKLANVHADLPSAALKDSGTFKMLVSGDVLTGEHKYEQPFNFRNRAKLIFSANELPPTVDRSWAFFRRWLVVRFAQQFGNGRPLDPYLSDKLRQPDARSYLLRLAVEGLQRLERRGGFDETDATQAELAEYRRAADNVVAFYEDCCEFNLDAVVPKQQVYGVYRSWCELLGTHPLDETRFSRRLKVLDPRIAEIRPSAPDGQRPRCWRGLRLLPTGGA